MGSLETSIEQLVPGLSNFISYFSLEKNPKKTATSFHTAPYIIWEADN